MRNHSARDSGPVVVLGRQVEPLELGLGDQRQGAVLGAHLVDVPERPVEPRADGRQTQPQRHRLTGGGVVGEQARVERHLVFGAVRPEKIAGDGAENGQRRVRTAHERLAWCTEVP